MPVAYEKIRSLKGMLELSGSRARIQVDGGVDPQNVPMLLEAGADILVSGSAFFNFPPYAERFKIFRQAAKHIDK